MKEITINNELYLLIKKEDYNKKINANDVEKQGAYNTGDRNTGNRNAGDRNTGSYNTGSWNTINFSTGFFNTKPDEDVYIFNKRIKISLNDILFPEFCAINLTEWTGAQDMSEKEKEENESYKTTGGYLKVYKYKEAFRKSWNNANLEDKKKILLVPNFDNEIFEEITGINVAKELNL